LKNDRAQQRYALKIFYLGDNYIGFQKQVTNNTIQGNIIQALKECGILDDEIKANFGYSGRTDRYVHSLGQVVAFNSFKRIIIREINSYLPRDIKFYAISKVDLSFKPRFDAKYRHYRYITYEEDLDIPLMKEASKEFLGKHDFKILSRGPHSDNTVREIYNIKIQEFDNSLVYIDIIGQSFLHEMVRRISDVLLRIGNHNLEISLVKEYLNPFSNKNLKVRAAPIKNNGDLILINCEYGLKFEYDNYTINHIKNLFIERIKNNYIENLTNKIILDHFNQIK